MTMPTAHEELRARRRSFCGRVATIAIHRGADTRYGLVWLQGVDRWH
jgi:hypothetical protein